LIDVNLPDGKGFTLAEKLKSIDPEILIIFTSSYGDFEEDHQKFEDCGGIYIQTPFTIIQIVDALKELTLKHK